MHTAVINNTLTSAQSFNPNSIYKCRASTLRVLNSIIWNDAAHSQNGRHLVNEISSSANDMVSYSILDSAKVRTINLNNRGTWEPAHLSDYMSDPSFVRIESPGRAQGGKKDGAWFTSQCGLMYAFDKPGVNDGHPGRIDYESLGLEWDIRGHGFLRRIGAPDIGPFERQYR